MNPQPLLLRVLSSNPNSHRISLPDNFIGDQGLQILVSFLRDHPNISVLELKGNNISPQGFSFLCDYLRTHYKLRVLICEWNNIGLEERGVQALSSLLQYNRNIKHVDLRNNKLGVADAEIIGNIIKTNNSLLSIDLRWNDLRNKGVELIFNGLKENFSLLYLEIQGNNVSGDLQHAIQSLLERNRAENPITKEEILSESERNEESSSVLQEKNVNLSEKIKENPLVNNQKEFRKQLEKTLNKESKAISNVMNLMDNEIFHLNKKIIDDESFLNDFNVKLQKLNIENQAYKTTIKTLRKDLEDFQASCSKSIKFQEERFSREKSSAQAKQKKIDSFFAKQSEQHQKAMRESSEYWREKCEILQNRVKDLHEAVSSLQIEEKELLTNLREKQAKFHEELQELHVKNHEEEEFFQGFRLRDLEEEIQLTKIDLLGIVERNRALAYKIKEMDERPPEELIYLVEENEALKNEREVFSQKKQEFVLLLDKLKLEIQVVQNRKKKIEKDTEELVEKFEKDMEHIEKENNKLNEKREEEKKHWRKEKEKLLEKIKESENKFAEETQIGLKLINGKQKLLHALQNDISKTVYEIFTRNKYI